MQKSTSWKDFNLVGELVIGVPEEGEVASPLGRTNSAARSPFDISGFRPNFPDPSLQVARRSGGHLHFQSLYDNAGKNKTFFARFFGGPKATQAWLVHPESAFAKIVALIGALLLLYTAIVIQFEVCFYWNTPPCSSLPTIKFDVFVDIFFVFQLLISFCSGTMVDGVYEESLRSSWWNYLKGSFLFDAVTSIPTSLMEYIVVAGCTEETANSNQHLGNLQLLRLVKPFRLLRLSRLLKIGAARTFMEWAEEKIRLPGYVLRTLQMIVYVFLVVHTTSCLFWLVKQLSSTEEQVCEFLTSRSLPCDGSPFGSYVVMIYFTNTIFATVGFGEITPQNTYERLYTIGSMFVGVMVFGTMLSEVQTMHLKASQLKRECEDARREVRDFLRGAHVPHSMRTKIISWLDLDYAVQQERNRQLGMISHIPRQLRSPIYLNMFKDYLGSIALFKAVVHPLKDRLLVRMFEESLVETFDANVPIATMDQVCDRVYIIRKGCVRVLLQNGSTVAVLNETDCFGESCLVGDPRWRGEHGMECEYVSTSSVVCIVIFADTFFDVLSEFPSDLFEEFSDLSRSCKAFVEKEQADLSTSTVRWFYMAKRLMSRRRANMNVSQLLRSARNSLLMQSLSSSGVAPRLSGASKVEERPPSTATSSSSQQDANKLIKAVGEFIKIENSKLITAMNRKLQVVESRISDLTQRAPALLQARGLSDLSSGQISPLVIMSEANGSPPGFYYHQ
ncbi:hypothetical protein GUITHDRAFT_142125 [Guillardia theta CCMP2712]|uniref:Cyclic nucleotide-binding domain-containing protein n=1 Tax=Guillardia theta (strain CCMP2712) TaxID=905079 RepID=L1IZ68_GUITC|nr:hypothetical protein GUITHDRAFT_142125 [Guillardia theta CCMP2712]EKX41194.1 hypothetical protein GUITHDRAFT_142125 [Guillardia theta CCMP2712]|eukprot:XP_005828174.1 hypothetical protein GUITHDRAFT_142125 [Guillardia theta CCMP2712]